MNTYRVEAKKETPDGHGGIHSIEHWTMAITANNDDEAKSLALGLIKSKPDNISVKLLGDVAEVIVCSYTHHMPSKDEQMAMSMHRQ